MINKIVILNLYFIKKPVESTKYENNNKGPKPNIYTSPEIIFNLI